MSADEQTEIAWDRFLGYLNGVTLRGRDSDRQRVLKRLDEIEAQVHKTRAEITGCCCSFCSRANHEDQLFNHH